MPSSSAETLTDRVYVDQVRSLYLSLTPAVVMWAAFVINFWLAYRIAPDIGLLALGIAGILASSARIGITALHRDRALTSALNHASARRLELLFSLPYLAFSLLLGVFGLYIFMWSTPQIHMLTICVVVGYCAGVATNCGLRPHLAVPSMLLAVAPPILVSMLSHGPAHLGMSVIASAFVFGAYRSILVRFEASNAEIGQRLASISLARLDVLTTLPNRLALQEYFNEHATLISPNRAIAVHYLDLDGFKPVNDRYGHAVGDALLLAVADRLRGAVRGGDIVARMGGDEFAVIQFGLHHPDEAKLLARRITAAIEQPFQIEQACLAISTSIGTVVNHDRNQGLDALLKSADAKLYEAKQNRRFSNSFALSA